MWTRRGFLGLAAGLLGGLALPRRAGAIGEHGRVRLAQVVHGGDWQPRPSALRRLLWEVDKRTAIDVALEPAEVRLSGELHRFPMLYLAGAASLPAPSDGEIGALRQHLQAGGLLVVDGAEERPGSFDREARALAARLFPSEPLGPLDEQHVLYRSFYLLRGAAGRRLIAPRLEAAIHDGRAAIVYCQNDLGGAWARDNFGRWEHEVVPGGETQRELAFRLGINLVMYATCLDYKTDQVHVPFILRRRRWKVP